MVKGGNATPVDINNSSGPAPTGITATDQHPGTSSVAGFGYSGWSATQDNGKYVQFTLKANIGQSVSISTVKFPLIGMQTGSGTAFLKVSTDGSTFTDFGASFTLPSGTLSNHEFINSTAVSTGSGGTLTFRLYVATPSGAANFYLMNLVGGGTTHLQNAIELNGDYSTIVTGCGTANTNAGAFTQNINGMTFTGNQFVAVGNAPGTSNPGVIYTSPHGAVWTSRTAPSAGNTNGADLFATTWSGQRIVALGFGNNNQTLLSSTDGVTWTNNSSAFTALVNPQAMVWTGSKFVSVGSLGIASSQGSDPSLSWTQNVLDGAAQLRGIAWSGSTLIAVGYDVNNAIFSVNQGVNWSPGSTGDATDLNAVAWTGSQFVAVGNGGVVYTSSNGTSWTSRTSGTAENLLSLVWTGSRLFAGTSAGKVLTSSDGITWSSFYTAGSNPIRALAWGGNHLVATSNTDAIYWDCSWGETLTVPADRWLQLGLPAQPFVGGTIANVLADAYVPNNLNRGNYVEAPTTTPSSGKWTIAYRDASANAYVRPPSSNVLDQSRGYWLKQWGTAGQINLPVGIGSVTPLVTSNSKCPSTVGCYEITLTAPASGADRANLVSFPFPWPVGWWEARLDVSTEATALTMSAAQSGGYMRSQYYVWNGSTYSAFDDSTPGLIGEEQNWQGIWVMVKSACSGKTCKLLIPAIPKTSQAPVGADRPWLARALDWLIPPVAAETIGPATVKGLKTRTVKQAIEGKSLAAGTSWYARLIVEAPSEKMTDRTNVFGHLVGTHVGYDDHDLPALTPFGRPYLDLVFPHRDWPAPWGSNGSTDPWVGSYNSDYRPPPSKKAETGAADWTFEIRSDQARTVLLSWEAPAKVLRRSKLVDNTTGKVYAFSTRALRDGQLWITMTQPVHTLTWRYKGR